MRESGIRAVALEVSSQALYQHRVDGIQFEATVFTNLYSDHVGPTEHPDFDHYKACKHRLFTNFPSRIALFNTDDANAQEMQENCAAHRILTYALDTTCADYAANNLLPTQSDKGYGISFSTKVDGTPESFSIPLLGKFNASNAIAVLAVAHECFGLSAHALALALKNAAVNGRTEAFRLASGACAVVDYAHNGESLCKLLTALREYKPSRLICLFGSVGERSQLRRREMGDVAARLCDLAILTSDNPGREDPSAIIADIARAFASTRTPYLAIPDRSDAIRQAVSLTRAGDILVLAGKGHEAYQLIGTEKLPFSDREELILANDSIQSN